MKKLIIAGSRTITDYHMVLAAFAYFATRNNWIPNTTELEIVSGGADGVDTLAERIAKNYGVPFKLFPANWKQLGRSAGPVRNAAMAQYADELLLIWDGESSGSSNMRTQMTSRAKPVSEVILCQR